MATSTVLSFRSVLTLNAQGMIRLEVPTQTRGTRILDISTVALKLVKLTDAEETVVNWLTDGLETGKVYPIDITLPELKTLGEVRAKIDNLYNAPKVKTIEQRVDETNKFVHQRVASRSSGNGMDAMEARVNGLQKVVKSLEEDFMMFQYDIPTVYQTECPNPSPILWRHGFRMTKSCWILAKSHMEHSDIVELLAHWEPYRKINPDFVVRIAKYDASEMETIRGWAEESLRKELVAVHTSLIQAIGTADENLKKAMETEGVTPRQMELADSKHDNHIRGAIKRVAATLDSVLVSAELFDQSENVADLIKTTREAIRVQRDTFNILMRQKGSKLSDAKI